MFKRPKTNCNFLFLNKNIVTIDNSADRKNRIGIVFKDKESDKNKSITDELPLKVVHRFTKKINPPEISPAIIK